MVQITVIRTKEGIALAGRKFEMIDAPCRDKDYGYIDLPPYECGVFEKAIANKNMTKDQVELLHNLALPLFPERSPGINDGEDWKALK